MHFLTLLSCCGKRFLCRRTIAVPYQKGLKTFEKMFKKERESWGLLVTFFFLQFLEFLFRNILQQVLLDIVL